MLLKCRKFRGFCVEFSMCCFVTAASLTVTENLKKCRYCCFCSFHCSAVPFWFLPGKVIDTLSCSLQEFVVNSAQSSFVAPKYSVSLSLKSLKDHNISPPQFSSTQHRCSTVNDSSSMHACRPPLLMCCGYTHAPSSFYHLDFLKFSLLLIFHSESKGRFFWPQFLSVA